MEEGGRRRQATARLDAREFDERAVSRAIARAPGSPHALRQVARHRCAALPDVYVDDDVVAIDVGIVYEFSLTTTEARYAQDKALMDRMLASWRFGDTRTFSFTTGE